MIITCGPSDDKRTITITLPEEKTKIGVLVSGGLDSAILYYLMLLENKNTGNLHEILPISMLRSEGSRYFSNIVVGHVNAAFKIPFNEAQLVGDNTLPDDQQVKSAVEQALNVEGFQIIYAGLIEQLPQHMVDWKPIPSKENKRFKTPLVTFNKSHIIDLIVQFKQEPLFYITHSCSIQKFQVGRCTTVRKYGGCNGCNERAWGFSQLGLTDPGTI
jgi:hypothetical protein